MEIDFELSCCMSTYTHATHYLGGMCVASNCPKKTPNSLNALYSMFGAGEIFQRGTKP